MRAFISPPTRIKKRVLRIVALSLLVQFLSLVAAPLSCAQSDFATYFSLSNSNVTDPTGRAFGGVAEPFREYGPPFDLKALSSNGNIEINFDEPTRLKATEDKVATFGMQDMQGMLLQIRDSALINSLSEQVKDRIYRYVLGPDGTPNQVMGIGKPPGEWIPNVTRDGWLEVAKVSPEIAARVLSGAKTGTKLFQIRSYFHNYTPDQANGDQVYPANYRIDLNFGANFNKNDQAVIGLAPEGGTSGPFMEILPSGEIALNPHTRFLWKEDYQSWLRSAGIVPDSHWDPNPAASGLSLGEITSKAAEIRSLTSQIRFYAEGTRRLLGTGDVFLGPEAVQAADPATISRTRALRALTGQVLATAQGLNGEERQALVRQLSLPSTDPRYPLEVFIKDVDGRLILGQSAFHPPWKLSAPNNTLSSSNELALIQALEKNPITPDLSTVPALKGQTGVATFKITSNLPGDVRVVEYSFRPGGTSVTWGNSLEVLSSQNYQERFKVQQFSDQLSILIRTLPLASLEQAAKVPETPYFKLLGVDGPIKAEIDARRQLLGVPASANINHPESPSMGASERGVRIALPDSVRLAETFIAELQSPSRVKKIPLEQFVIEFSPQENQALQALQRSGSFPATITDPNRQAILDSLKTKITSAIDSQFMRPLEAFLDDLRTNAINNNPELRGEGLEEYISESRQQMLEALSVFELFDRSVKTLYDNIRLPQNPYPLNLAQYQAAETYATNDRTLSFEQRGVWLHRGVDRATAPARTWRASLNVHISVALLKALDQMITSGAVVGSYMIGRSSPQSNAQGHLRHNSVTFYFTEEPSQAARAMMVKIAETHGRGAHALIGEKIAVGASICPVFDHEHLVPFLDTIEKLFPAIGYQLKDTLNRGTLWNAYYAISEGQYEAARIALERLGIELKYQGPELLVTKLPSTQSIAPPNGAPHPLEGRFVQPEASVKRSVFQQLFRNIRVYPQDLAPRNITTSTPFLSGARLQDWPFVDGGSPNVQWFSLFEQFYPDKVRATVRDLFNGMSVLTPNQARVLNDFAAYGGRIGVFWEARPFAYAESGIELGFKHLLDPQYLLHEAAHFNEPRILDLYPAFGTENSSPALRDIKTIYRELLANRIGLEHKLSLEQLIAETARSYQANWLRLVAASSQQPELLGGKLLQIPPQELLNRLDQAIARELFAPTQELMLQASQGQIGEADFRSKLSSEMGRLHWRTSVREAFGRLSMQSASSLLQSNNLRAFHILAIHHDLWGRTEADVASFESFLAQAGSKPQLSSSISQLARSVISKNPLLFVNVIASGTPVLDPPTSLPETLASAPLTIAQNQITAAVIAPGQVIQIPGGSSPLPPSSGATATVALPFNSSGEAQAFLGSGRYGFSEVIPLKGGLTGNIPESPFTIFARLPQASLIEVGNGLVRADVVAGNMQGALSRPEAKLPSVSGRFMLPTGTQIWSSTINDGLIGALPEGTTSLLTGPALSTIPDLISRALPPAEASLRNDITKTVGVPETARLYELAYANRSFSEATVIPNSIERPSWISFHRAEGAFNDTKIDFTFQGSQVNVGESSLKVGGLIMTGPEGRFEGLMLGYKGSGPAVPNAELGAMIPRSAGMKAFGGLAGLFAFSAADAAASNALLDFARGQSLGTVTITALQGAKDGAWDLLASPAHLGIGVATLPLFTLPGVGQGAMLGAGIAFSAKTVEAMDAEGTTEQLIERVAAIPSVNPMGNRASAWGFVMFGRAMYSIENALADEISDRIASIWYDVPPSELDGNSRPLPLLKTKSPEYHTTHTIFNPLSESVKQTSTLLAADPGSTAAQNLDARLWNPNHISSPDAVPRPEEWRDYMTSWAQPAAEFGEFAQSLTTDTSYDLPTTTDIRLASDQSAVRLSYVLAAGSLFHQETGFGEQSLSFSQPTSQGERVGLFGSALEISPNGLGALRRINPVTGAASQKDGPEVQLASLLTNDAPASGVGIWPEVNSQTVFDFDGVKSYLSALYSKDQQTIRTFNDTVTVSNLGTGGFSVIGQNRPPSALREVAQSMQVELLNGTTFTFSLSEDVSIIPFRPRNIGEQSNSKTGTGEVVKELERLKAIKEKLKSTKQTAKISARMLQKQSKRLLALERSLLKDYKKFTAALAKGALVVQFEGKPWNTIELVEYLATQIEMAQQSLPVILKAYVQAEGLYQQIKSQYKSVKSSYNTLRKQFRDFNILNKLLQDDLRKEAVASTTLAEKYLTKNQRCSREDFRYASCVDKYSSPLNLQSLTEDVSCKQIFEECRTPGM